MNLHTSSSSMYAADYSSLACLFVTWKLLLFGVACASPGPGYDTSTHILFHQTLQDDSLASRLLGHIVSKFVRWDALYFTSVAQRGYLFEQEWAWGWGYTRFLALVSKVTSLSSFPPLYVQALSGMLVSHVSHLLSAFLLYAVTLSTLPVAQPHQRKVAFVAASLYIFSPAGLFLSAPYAESLFSTLNFAGVLLHSRISKKQQLHEYGILSLLGLLASGACFGLASTVRSNGVFSGLVFVYQIFGLLKSRLNLRTVLTVVVTGLSGGLVLLGFLGPQYIAYEEFCTGESPRPWCSRTFPSVYTWVQSHYWNVGFLRYWTLSNVPLFLLALPVSLILIVTGLIASSNRSSPTFPKTPNSAAYMLCLALPQLLLALLAFTSFHVQIINRISTGYPVWYMVLAACMTLPHRLRNDRYTTPPDGNRSAVDKCRDHLSQPATQQVIFRAMFMYAVIQGGLYASFLPPA